MPSRSVIALAAITVVSAVVVSAVALHRPGSASSTAVARTPVEVKPLRESQAPRVDSAPTPAPIATVETLQSSHDYFEYAQSLIAAAKGGDHQAQYNLSRALEYCDNGYGTYFDRRKGRRTFDEALQWAAFASPALSTDEVRDVYARCQRLKDKTLTSPPFGESADWLLAASNGGYPLAQVGLALQLLVESRKGLGEWSKDVEVDTGKLEEARKLTAQALRSKDPAVLWEAADLGALYTDDIDEASRQQWVWRLAACQRGYDCSSTGQWREVYCRMDPNCQPYESAQDYIRRVRSEDFEELEQQAHKLNASMDAGDFTWSR